MQRELRLRHSADFERVRSRGRSWYHPLVAVSVAPNLLSHNRYGFIASRRVGNAVVRNRVRRVLREAVRRSEPRLKTGFDITLVARNEIVTQPYTRVCDVLEELFKRANLWQGEGTS